MLFLCKAFYNLFFFFLRSTILQYYRVGTEQVWLWFWRGGTCTCNAADILWKWETCQGSFPAISFLHAHTETNCTPIIMGKSTVPGQARQGTKPDTFHAPMQLSPLTVSEEGPAWLAPVERGQGLLLLAHECIPPHLVGPSQLPHFLQTALQVVNGVIRPVVHQTCQQALETMEQGMRNARREGGGCLAGHHYIFVMIYCSVAMWQWRTPCCNEFRLWSAHPVSLAWLGTTGEQKHHIQSEAHEITGRPANKYRTPLTCVVERENQWLW